MARLPLTEEQKAAATSPAERLFIEASPGSGKTTVAAERFGVVRFASGRATGAPVVALSFTRSATAELRTRVVRRWGSAASAWPHRIETIDTFLRRLLEYLLRQGSLAWPSEHTQLEMLDDWHGHPGFRPLQIGDWCRVMEVQADGTIRTKGVQLAEPAWGFNLVGAIKPLLEAGLATPREVRQTLTEAFSMPAIQALTKDYLKATVGHLLVDEIFDANELDLRIVRASCLVHVPVTLIGDPWQALYGWRGASPDLVEPLVTQNQFVPAELPQSFRFECAQTQDVAALLRSGSPTPIPVAVTFDVALARKWKHLWALPPSILPLSFGRPQNQTQAALVLLLNMVTTARLGREALFLREALLILGIDGEALNANGPAILAQVLEQLDAGMNADDVLSGLRDAVVAIGAGQRPPAGSAAKEAVHCANLLALADRLGAEAVVPGLTVHQAKGLEWDSVAVNLTADDANLLAAGLMHTQDDHRVLYVALTRARWHVGRL